MKQDSVYAHTPNVSTHEWHLLLDHLGAVADLAGAHGAKFGAGRLCELLGWLHDAGKFNPAFQEYLRACARGEPPHDKVPHAVVGAWLARSCSPAVFPLLGHHAGLHDSNEVKERLALDASEVAQLALSALANAGVEIAFDQNMIPAGNALQTELLIRMAFSALVDADYLDTERHFDAGLSERRGPSKPLRRYAEELDARLSQFRPDSPVNKVRCEILDDCRRAANRPPGLFRLTVPTGGGKTLSGLAFALKHAVAHGLDRVVVAIPYTSIIEQTADVYADIFGPDHVVEHHSAVAECDRADEGQSELDLRRRLAAENWDARLVVTTNVQLFESLFSNRPSRCRKLHNLARSVIVLDEVQTLPTVLTEPIVVVLRQIAEALGSTIVLCSATQPAFETLGIGGVTDIVPEPERHFTALRRVDFERRSEKVGTDALAVELSARDQCLCVLNGRKDAVAVFEAISEAANTFHLSTLMCPAHRRRVLAEVRARLASNARCRLISTQVVEAGVDIDFQVVYRALAPLDRIVQAAGRCNREGKLAVMGQCVVFELVGGTHLRGEYQTGTDLARAVLTGSANALTHPATLRGYYTDLFRNCNTDAEGIGKLRLAFRFREVAERFRLISEDTQSVVVPYGGAPVDALLSEAQRLGVVTGGLARRLSPYTVSLYRRELDRRLGEGLIEETVPGLFVWRGRYDEKTGIGGMTLADPADLIA